MAARLLERGETTMDFWSQIVGAIPEGKYPKTALPTKIVDENSLKATYRFLTGDAKSRRALALAVTVPLAQVAIQASPCSTIFGCTTFGCNNVFKSVLDTIYCTEECLRYFLVVSNPPSCVSRLEDEPFLHESLTPGQIRARSTHEFLSGNFSQILSAHH